MLITPSIQAPIRFQGERFNRLRTRVRASLPSMPEFKRPSLPQLKLNLKLSRPQWLSWNRKAGMVSLFDGQHPNFPKTTKTDTMTITPAVAIEKNPNLPSTPTKIEDVLNALEKDNTAFFANVLNGKQVVLLEDTEAQCRILLLQKPAKAGETATKPVLWCDFYSSNPQPHIERLSKKFTFANPKQESPENSHLAYELPDIDEDSMQLTAYAIRMNPHTREIVRDDSVRMYVGDDFFITTHLKPRASIDKTMEQTLRSGKYHSPQELMGFTLTDIIVRYGKGISSLTSDVKKLSDCVTSQNTDKNELSTQFQHIADKIHTLFETIQLQQGVLIELVEMNQLENSPLVEATGIKKTLKSLDYHQLALDRFQTACTNLLSIFQTNVTIDQTEASNRMNDVMKKLASATVLGVLPTVGAGLYGMNVALPGAQDPHMFWYVLGGLSTVSVGLWGILKKRGWL